MSRQKEKWKLVRGSWISTQNVLPGVWQRKEGGHVVRARAMNRRNGKQTEIWKVLPDKTASEALQWLDSERARIRDGIDKAKPSKTPFATFAVSLLERKIKAGDIKSQAGIHKWGSVLKRLIESRLGELFVETLCPQDFIDWRNDAAAMIADGNYAPTTMNTDLSVLRVILKHAKIEFGLVGNPVEAIVPFDTSQHATYSYEEPNSLTVEELRDFLACMRVDFPQHFAMTFVGFCLGKRPSTLRPLRRKGPTPDVLWDQGVLLFRRSNTFGQEVMQGVKTGGEERVHAPEELFDVLRWHVDTQLRLGPQQESELLFPSLTGGFRARSVLDKPFAEVATNMGLAKRITPRGMRRTFQDLCRAASVSDLVTRSISGHATETMQRHYSTVSAQEQQNGLANVIRLIDFQSPLEGGEESGEVRSAGGEDR